MKKGLPFMLYNLEVTKIVKYDKSVDGTWKGKHSNLASLSSCQEEMRGQWLGNLLCQMSCFKSSNTTLFLGTLCSGMKSLCSHVCLRTKKLRFLPCTGFNLESIF